MKAVLISFTLLLLFLQASAEESQDASVSREVRAADAGEKDARANKRKKECKGNKCQKRTKERRKGKGKKEKCRKGKNCTRRNKGKGRKAKGRKETKEKRPRGRKGGKGKKGGKGSKGKGRKGRKGKGGKGKKGKRLRYNIEFNRKSDRQTIVTVPAKCTADECSASDYVSLFNKYKQNDNMLRQLQRLVRFYDLIRKKQASALTTFQPALEAIKDSTSDCTMCQDSSVSASALGNCTLLKNCSVSAPSVCSTTGITHGKGARTPIPQCPDTQGDPDSCPLSSPNFNPNTVLQCGDGCPPGTGPPLCTNVCKADPVNEPDLTEADKTYAENDCLPVLRNWTKQYRDCNAGDTFKCQQSGCNDKKGECNLLNCRCDTPKRTCDFEECVDATNATGKEYESYVCNTCLKKLDDLLEIPAKCKTIAKYERAVFARKEECIRKDIKGSFGDCARAQKAIIPFIRACSNCGPTTTVAPSGRRLSALKNQNMMLNNKKQFW